ncbi:MAG: UPF0489 family protein [Pseudomonadota bacterium]
MNQWISNDAGDAEAASFEHIVIAGKSIYVVDDHHKALAAWAEERRKLDAPPNLITIDHHTDVYEAFSSHASCAQWDAPDADQEAIRNGRISMINWKDENSVMAAIELLKHDEHIHAATMSGVLHAAFCIQLSDGGGTPLEQAGAGNDESNAQSPGEPTASEPESTRIYIIPFKCAIACHKPIYDDECKIHHGWDIIETPYLEDQLARGVEFARCIGKADMESAPYILDIDLDAFHSSRAVQPQDPSTFYRLIRNAIAITIATEAECVDELWLDPTDKLTADQLLGIILDHIKTALKTQTV